MRAHQAEYPIRTMCRVLEVSTSGYYAWRGRRPSARASEDERLKRKIGVSHDASRGTYGAPRIRKDLSEDGIKVSQRRVSRLMRSLEIQGVSRRRGFKTTRRSGAEPAPDLVNRDFTAKGPNRLWIADITYVPTMVGFVFLAIILDVWSRRVVGWSMRRDLKEELAIEALDMAVENRGLCDVKHHSDCGCQYTSSGFRDRCELYGVELSMGSVGDCFDNAMAESFFATLECELLDRTCFLTKEQAEVEIFDFIEGFYNTKRRHSSIEMLSPAEFERINWPNDDPSARPATRFRRTTELVSLRETDSSLRSQDITEIPN